MNNRENIFGAVALAMLIMLIVWGDAWAMLVISTIGLVLGLVMLRKNPIRGELVVATAFLLAGKVAGMQWLWHGH